MNITAKHRVICAVMAVHLAPVAGVTTLPAHAQAGVLEEVVVVARKREESLQDTAIAVSAFGADQLREAQITNVADLAQNVPGLSNKDGDRVSGLTIRGVGSRAVGAAVDPGVGVYVDGIFMPRSDTQLVDVVEMESIQVLRGPQGTLFGKNTAGGALLLQSRKPEEEFTIQVEGGLGERDRRNFAGRVDGPLVENTLYGAITYDVRKEDGYMDDFYTDVDYGDTDRQAVVGQLRWYPTEELTVDLIALWGERDENAAPTTCRVANPNSTLSGFASTTPGFYQDFCEESEALVDNEKVIMDSTGLEYDVTNNLAGVTVDWDLGEVTLKSVTGYLYQDDLKRETDVDGSPFFSISNFGETQRQLSGSGIDAKSEERQFISQEFNLFGSFFDGDVDYTLGIYASDEQIDDQVDGQALALGGWVGAPPGFGDVNTLPAIVGFRPSQIVDYTSTSAAGFGQFIYNLNEQWQFTVGGRWTWEEKKINQDNYQPALGDGTLGTVTREEMNALSDFLHEVIRDPATPTFKEDDDWTEFTPMATATFFMPDSWTDGFLDSGMLYLTYSEGFKAGGFTSFGPDRALSFDPETVDNIEFGFKLEMWDQRLRVNGALYTMDYDDMQLGVTRRLGENNTVFGITNAGKAEVEGAELEVVVMPLEGLLITLTGSYIDADYDEFFDEFEDAEGNLQIADRSDEPFSYVPEQTYSWAVSYDWETTIATITPRISGFYKDEVYTGLDPAAFMFEDIATLDDHTVWNARLAVRPHAVEGLEVAAFVENLDDEFYYGTGTIEAARLGSAGAIRGRPRTYGVDIFYRW